MAERIFLGLPHSDEYVASLVGKSLDDSAYDLVFGGPEAEDVDVYTPYGSLLLKYRSRVLPLAVCKRAFAPAKSAARVSQNRGTAAGGRYSRINEDGSLSRTTYTKPVRTGIIGYFDRTSRLPYCRTTAFTATEVAKWHRIVPFVRACNDVFRTELPGRYKWQEGQAKRTPPEFVIAGTAFTTVTVNRNFATHVHRDKGDLRGGFGVMSVMRAGVYQGGLLVFPKYRVAVDLCTQDVLLADVHELHGNTPIVGIEGRFDRISLVMYYRTGMRECGTRAEELARQKSGAG